VVEKTRLVSLERRVDTCLAVENEQERVVATHLVVVVATIRFGRC
jgi:hypothetical protein